MSYSEGIRIVLKLKTLGFDLSFDRDPPSVSKVGLTDRDFTGSNHYFTKQAVS